MLRTVAVMGLVLLFASLAGCTGEPVPPDGAGAGTITVSSEALDEGEGILQVYTCDGNDISPPIGWTGVPGEARSLVLVMDDPDAPMGTFTHWIMYRIPPETTFLPAGQPAGADLPGGMVQGENDFGVLGYRGPCPPAGEEHRYRFTVYALDTLPDPGEGVDDAALYRMIEGHVLASGTLAGTYRRSSPL
jgi:Raf kinase inhibitor-like YbhB/YbcL family protein